MVVERHSNQRNSIEFTQLNNTRWVPVPEGKSVRYIDSDDKLCSLGESIINKVRKALSFFCRGKRVESEVIPAQASRRVEYSVSRVSTTEIDEGDQLQEQIKALELRILNKQKNLKAEKQKLLDQSEQISIKIKEKIRKRQEEAKIEHKRSNMVEGWRNTSFLMCESYSDTTIEKNIFHIEIQSLEEKKTSFQTQAENMTDPELENLKIECNQKKLEYADHLLNLKRNKVVMQHPWEGVNESKKDR